MRRCLATAQRIVEFQSQRGQYSPCFDPVDLSLIKRSMRLCHQNSLRLLIRNHREASVLSPLAHTPQYELVLSS